MGIKFNFEKGSLDFFKNIRTMDIIIILMFIVLILSMFRDDIKRITSFKQKEETQVGKDTILQHDIFGEGIEDAMELEYVLNDIVKTYDVDYINVNLFHNGTISPSGYHFKKMSCVAEGKRLDKLPRIHKLQNWVVDPFKEKIAETKKVGHVYIKNLPDDQDPYFSKEIPKYGILSVFYVGLFDHRKKDSKGRPHFIGFISFGWERTTNFSEKTLVSMEKEKTRITEFILK